MCDETTDRELDEYLKRKGLTRRGFGASASIAMAVGASSLTACATPFESESSLMETDVEIPSPDGTIDAKFFFPVDGAHAAIIFWPDIHGTRPAFFDMAKSLAAKGYAVIAANPYYRTHTGRLFPEGMTLRDEGGRELVTPHYQALSPATVKTDAAAIVDWLDTQEQVDTSRGIGAVGFCMTGSWTLRAAAEVPERIKAPTSFHGGGLVTDADDSPHKLARNIQGGVLIAIAENDHERQPEAEGILIQAFADAGVPAEIEVYEGAMHGWVPTDGRAHDPEASQRAWGRMLALFERELG